MFRDGEDVRRRMEHLLRDWIRPAVVRTRVPLHASAWDVPDEPVPFAEALTHEFTPIEVGQGWSHPWGTTWLRLSGTVPADWGSGRSADHRVEAVVDLGFNDAEPGFQAEGTVYRTDGTVLKGLEPRNRYVPIAAVPGEDFEFIVEAASNPVVQPHDWTTPSALGVKETAGRDPIYTLDVLDLCDVDTTVESLVLDIEVLDGWIRVLPEDSARRAVILEAFERAIDAIDPDDVAGTAAGMRDSLAPALAAHANTSALDVYAVGHAHIDSAWLWPVRETVRKVARTFSNVLHLMDVDPDFVFAATSAQQYEWMRKSYPDVFAGIQRRVAEGRWVIVGGQWVESDPYMIGGEAFIRQFSEGLRFFEQYFGVRPREVWLPDSFGYSAALPGIAHHLGMTRMLTQKLSWNETNAFPHHTFWWEGLDGSELFTHFPSVDTYGAVLSAEELSRCEHAFRELGEASATLVPFGYGDGGGGPTREILGFAHRQANLEGSPRVHLSSPDAFFTAAEAEYPDAPTWVGELYLENHRGVLTSQHRTKRGNRRSEHLLREAEMWAATATIRTGAPYPDELFHELWQTVLLLQFHDILPGSSIGWVYEDAEASYAHVEDEAQASIATSLRVLAGQGDRVLVANPGAFDVGGIAMGAIAAPAAEPATPVDLVGPDSGWTIDNGLLHVHVREDGLVDSLVDREADREVVPAGEVLGGLTLYRDIPNNWDAWNIDRDHRRHGHPLRECDSVEVTRGEDGSVLVCTRRHWGQSSFVQEMRVSAGSSDLDFTTEVDWHERRKVLRLEFPLDVHTDHAQSEIQFGHVDRPIHTNTSWDFARFETIGLRWVRVAEPDFGITVANDQTYGHGISREKGTGGTHVLVSEALLRSPMAPDPEADQGHHILHTTLAVGTTIREAIEEGYRLNAPLRAIRADHEVAPLVGVVSGNAVVEAIKLADDGSGDLIVRLYEALGTRTTAMLDLDAPTGDVHSVDGTESPIADGPRIETEGEGRVSIALTPFQIATIRVGITR